MPEKIEIDGSLLKLIRKGKVAAVDPHNKVIFLKRGSKDEMVKFMQSGYKVYTVGRLHFVDAGQNEYLMPRGCSPVHIEGGTTVTTALHCVADEDMNPRSSVDLLLVNGSLPEEARIQAVLKNYTPVRKCGLWCRLLMRLHRLPKKYINFREIAWLDIPADASNYEPLQQLETLGHVTAGSDSGDFMLFSPLPGKEDKIQPGVKIAYISYNYDKNRFVYTETTVMGYTLAYVEAPGVDSEDGYLFYLPYAFEPGKVIVQPGYSGSAVKLKANGQ